LYLQAVVLNTRVIYFTRNFWPSGDLVSCVKKIQALFSIAKFWIFINFSIFCRAFMIVNFSKS
jgi:hypothetical protein